MPKENTQNRKRSHYSDKEWWALSDMGRKYVSWLMNEWGLDQDLAFEVASLVVPDEQLWEIKDERGEGQT